MNDKTIEYWIELARYDLETARAMLQTKRYLYVGFMAHQVIEKALKALYVASTQQSPPHTHNLTVLADELGLLGDLSDDQTELLLTLTPMNIQARYPHEKEGLLRSLSEEKCRSIVVQTSELYQWIIKKLDI